MKQKMALAELRECARSAQQGQQTVKSLLTRHGERAIESDHRALRTKEFQHFEKAGTGRASCGRDAGRVNERRRFETALLGDAAQDRFEIRLCKRLSLSEAGPQGLEV
jgi:hypothetical protein